MAAVTSRKFREFSFYSSPNGEQYYLLPFRFHRISAVKEVIVNEIGDFLVLPLGTVERIIERRISKQDDAELYADLTANFFISDKRVPDIIDVISVRYRTKKSFIENFTSLHIFVITLRCEHTCHYCQVSRVTDNKTAYDMSLADIDSGIALMMRSPNPHVTMEFQGGEALLAFDSIRYAIHNAKAAAARHDKSITFVICTNLALMTEDIAIYCKDNGVLISTSLDGPDYIHNANRHRPGNNSYDLAVAGISLSRRIVGRENVSALLTTTTLSLRHPYEIVDEYVSLGFNNIFLRPISPYGFATHNAPKNKYQTEAFLSFYKQALERILHHNRAGYHIREDYASIILRKMLTPFSVGYVDLQSPAGIVNSVIVFNYDGKVYASDEARMLAEMGDETFVLGKLGVSSYEEIFYGEKTVQLSEAWLNESLPGCSECAFLPFCGADPVLNHSTQGDMAGHRPTSVFCQKNMEIIRYLIELMDEDKEVETIFRSWIKG